MHFTELYLLAFGALRGEFSERELSSWGETMAERGLRLRQGLEDVLLTQPERTHAHDDDDDDEDNGEDEEEDEIESNARELRRLRPY